MKFSTKSKYRNIKPFSPLTYLRLYITLIFTTNRSYKYFNNCKPLRQYKVASLNFMRNVAL